MPRSDNSFPLYAKFKLDPNDPPEGWNDGARRCIRCKKDWPNVPQFGISPCCGATAGNVHYADLSPAMTWRQAVSDLNHYRFEYYYEVWNEELSDEQLYWLDRDLWIDSDELAEGLAEIEKIISEHGTTNEPRSYN